MLVKCSFKARKKLVKSSLNAYKCLEMLGNDCETIEKARKMIGKTIGKMIWKTIGKLD
jgi:hypothetical protein